MFLPPADPPLREELCAKGAIHTGLLRPFVSWRSISRRQCFHRRLLLWRLVLQRTTGGEGVILIKGIASLIMRQLRHDWGSFTLHAVHAYSPVSSRACPGDNSRSSRGESTNAPAWLSKSKYSPRGHGARDIFNRPCLFSFVPAFLLIVSLSPETDSIDCCWKRWSPAMKNSYITVGYLILIFLLQRGKIESLGRLGILPCYYSLLAVNLLIWKCKIPQGDHEQGFDKAVVQILGAP